MEEPGNIIDLKEHIPDYVQLSNKKCNISSFNDDISVFGDSELSTFGIFKDSLLNCGIDKGDVVIINSEIMTLGRKFKDLVKRYDISDFFLSGLLDVVGSQGAIIIPTYSYSFCRQEIYNPAESDTSIGMLPKRILQWHGVYRNTQPIFSYTGIGSKCKELFKADNTDCFGKESFNAKIYKNDWKLCCLGEKDLQMATSLHSIEQEVEVPYRYVKRFPGIIKIDKNCNKYYSDYYVRDLSQTYVYDFSQLQKKVNFEGCYRRSKFGLGSISCYRTNELWEIGKTLLEHNHYSFAKNNNV